MRSATFSDVTPVHETVICTPIYSLLVKYRFESLAQSPKSNVEVTVKIRTITEEVRLTFLFNC
jgi:hypothetical protein